MNHRKVILMYHSVATAKTPGVLGSFPIPLARFAYQVEQARAQGWQFGRISELRKPVSANTVYVTGDDGTVDWAANALPWCEEHGIPTHTGIITGPWQQPPVYPVAHRLQILLSLPGHELPAPALNAEQRAYIDRVYAYETQARRRYLKGACNVVLTDEESRGLLGPPDAEECQHLVERFAPPATYRGWRYAEFGAHTVSHRAFGGDPEIYVREEVLPCVAAIERHGLRATKYFTLPMRPRFPATVEQLIPALQAHGFEGVLDQQGEWDGTSFLVTRIDAKNVETCLGLEPWSEHDQNESDRLARAEVPR